MTPTREQVVQWIGQTNIDLNALALSEDDAHEIGHVISLAQANLEATIAEQAAEIERLRNVVDLDAISIAERNDQLRQQLTEQAARIERLLECVKLSTEYRLGNPAYEYALTTECANSSLREYGAKLVERIAADCELSTKLYLRAIAGKIRKGEF